MRRGIRVVAGLATVAVCVGLLQVVPAAASEKLPEQSEWVPGADFVPPETLRPPTLDEQEEPEPLPVEVPASEVPADSPEGVARSDFEARMDEVAERALEAVSPVRSQVVTPDPPTEIQHPASNPATTAEPPTSTPTSTPTPSNATPSPTASPSPVVTASEVPRAEGALPEGTEPVVRLASRVVRASTTEGGCQADRTSPDGAGVYGCNMSAQSDR